eukprot:3094362-Pyramimonas_sp.AAC.1
MSISHTGSLPPSCAEGAEIKLHSLNPRLARSMLGPAGLPDPRGGGFVTRLDFDGGQPTTGWAGQARGRRPAGVVARWADSLPVTTSCRASQARRPAAGHHGATRAPRAGLAVG